MRRIASGLVAVALALAVAAGCATKAAPTPTATPASDSASGASSAATKTPASPFAVRGVIEGFYGPPWSWSETTAVLAFMGAQGMNTFVYAPKNDPFQRSEWNRPYPSAQLSALRKVVAAASKDGVDFVYSISPGLSVQYSALADRAALETKLAQLRSIGVHHFMISLDDLGSNPTLDAADQAAYHDSLAAAQVDFTNAVYATERKADPKFTLMFTPTEYYGTKPDAYLRGIAALDPAIEIAWTGAGVIAPTLTVADARAFGAIVGRKPVVWYNYPVNDWTVPLAQQQANLPAVQPRDLFMGPVRGLGPDLAQGVIGILANPMIEPLASEIPLTSFAAYLQDPKASVSAAWSAAVAKAGGASAGALRAFASAEMPYPAITSKGRYEWTSTDPGVDAEENQLLAAYARSPSTALAGTAAQQLRGTFQSWIQAAPALAAGHLPSASLAGELQPWVRWMGPDGQAGLDALALLQANAAGGGQVLQAAQTKVQQDLNTLSAQPVEFGGDVAGFLRNTARLTP